MYMAGSESMASTYRDTTGRELPPFGALLRQQAQAMPQRPFVIVDDERMTYGELCERALAVARGMTALGLDRGDRIAILMPNCLDFVVAYFAIQLIGGIVVPVNARFKSHELAHVLAHSDMKMLLTTDRIDEHVNFADLIWQTLPELDGQAAGVPLGLERAPALRTIVLCGDSRREPAISLDDLVEAGNGVAEEPAGAASVDDISVMLYTSGTTAAPKGCQLTHHSIYHSWLAGYATAVGLADGESVWAPLPFFHVGGIGPMTAVLARGATMLSSVHFEPEVALEQIRVQRPDHLYPGFFTILLPILRVPGYQKSDLASARSAISVAPYETQMLMKEMMPEGLKVLQIFAMTEASGYVTVTRPDASEEHRLKTNGTPLPGVEVRIVDPESGHVAAPGVDGEIQFRGPVAFHSYYGDEAATRAAKLADGWVSTGDHGRMDADGTVYFLGRIKDMLKVGGENVAALEIEDYLNTHPAVKLSQVIAKPDDRYGEVPVAFIELLDGKSADSDGIIDFCKGRLASFKIPREVILVTEWPMSATKIQKFKLRERLVKESE